MPLSRAVNTNAFAGTLERESKGHEILHLRGVVDIHPDPHRGDSTQGVLVGALARGARRLGRTSVMTLARLLCPLEPVDPHAIVTGPPTDAAKIWLKAVDWRVLAGLREPSDRGEVIQTFELPDGRSVPATVVADQSAVAVPFDPDEAYRNLVSERWREGDPRA